MADTKQSAPAPNGYIRSGDEESVAELKRKRNMKRLAYFAIFVVFQIIVITIFSLTVMKVQRPKFRVGSATVVESLEQGNATNPSFSMRMNAQFTVKNTNFGQYKFDNASVTFAYKGVQVGEAFIAKSKAKFKSTKKIKTIVDLSSKTIVDLSSNNLSSISELGSDISSGILTLTSESKLNGKVHLMMVMKKKKTTQMNCTMEVVIATKAIQNLKCK